MDQNSSVFPLQSAKAREIGELWREKWTRVHWTFPFKLTRTSSFRLASTNKWKTTLVLFFAGFVSFTYRSADDTQCNLQDSHNSFRASHCAFQFCSSSTMLCQRQQSLCLVRNCYFQSVARGRRARHNFNSDNYLCVPWRETSFLQRWRTVHSLVKFIEDFITL